MSRRRFPSECHPGVDETSKDTKSNDDNEMAPFRTLASLPNVEAKKINVRIDIIATDDHTNVSDDKVLIATNAEKTRRTKKKQQTLHAPTTVVVKGEL